MISLAELEGRWRMRRRILDRRAGVTGHLTGHSLWERAGPGLRQTESGTLRYGAAPPMQATRSYLWTQSGAGLEVCFADGRAFHQIAPDQDARAEALHACDPDTYQVRYDFAQWPVWFSRWHVTGPRKDAVILTRFQRFEG